MPAFVKTESDEKRWAKAKSIARRQYPDVSADSEAFWKLTTGIYKRMNSIKITKQASYTPIMTKREQRQALQKVAAITGEDVGSFLGGTATSVAGGMAGNAIGAAIGTAILPGVGTVVGGLLGGLAGGMVTSGVGEKVGGKIGGMFDSKKEQAAPDPAVIKQQMAQQPMLSKSASVRCVAAASYNIRKQAAWGTIANLGAKLAPKLVGAGSKAAAVAGKAATTVGKAATTAAGKAGAAAGKAVTAAKPVVTNVANKAAKVGGQIVDASKTNLKNAFSGGVGGFAREVAKDAAVGGLITAGVSGVTALASRGQNTSGAGQVGQPPMQPQQPAQPAQRTPQPQTQQPMQ